MSSGTTINILRTIHRMGQDRERELLILANQAVKALDRMQAKLEQVCNERDQWRESYEQMRYAYKRSKARADHWKGIDHGTGIVGSASRSRRRGA